MPWYPEYESDEALRYIIDSHKQRLNRASYIYDTMIDSFELYDLHSFNQISKSYRRTVRLCRNKIFKAQIELHDRGSREMAMAISNLQPRVKEQST